MGVVHLQDYRFFQDVTERTDGIIHGNILELENAISDKKLESLICKAARETDLRAKIDLISSRRYCIKAEMFEEMRSQHDGRDITIQWHRIPVVKFWLPDEQQVSELHFSFYARGLISDSLIGRPYRRKKEEYLQRLAEELTAYSR